MRVARRRASDFSPVNQSAVFDAAVMAAIGCTGRRLYPIHVTDNVRRRATGVVRKSHFLPR
jgi:hypothetical protein